MATRKFEPPPVLPGPPPSELAAVAAYGYCYRCHAEAGMPCLNLRPFDARVHLHGGVHLGRPDLRVMRRPRQARR